MTLTVDRDIVDRIDWYEDVVRNGLLVLTLGVALSYIFSGFPFALLFDDAAPLRAGFRVAFGSIFLASLLQTRDALPIVLGYEAVGGKPDWRRLSTFYLQFPLVVLLIVGLTTEVAALLLLVVRTLFELQTKRFGLENTLNQMIIVHLPFLGVGAAYSLDAVLGIPTLLASPVMFNSLFVLTGIMTISGAYHKIGSEMWQNGRAVKEFLKLPHLRVPYLRGVSLPVPGSLSALLSYSTVFAQLVLLFSVLNRYAFLLVCLIFIGFSISMFAVVDLSFIGQTFLLIFLLYGGAVLLAHPTYPSLNLLTTVNLTGYTALAALIAVLGAFTVLRLDLVAGTPVRTAARLLSGQNAAVKPFNEHHLRGVHTFRFIYEEQDGDNRYPALEVFDEDGWQGQYFRPRYFQASVYVVTDYCLCCTHDAMPESEKLPEVVDLCGAALLSTGNSSGDVHLQIKIFDGDLEEYLESDWQPIGTCHFDNGDARWELQNEPSRIAEHPRLEFEDELKNA